MSPSRDHAYPTLGIAEWLGRYLALTIFLTGLVGTGLGALIASTVAWTNVNNTLSAHQKLLDDYSKQQKIFESEMVDVDRRLNQAKSDLADSERRSHDEIASLHEKYAVLDAKVGLFGSRTIPPQPQGGNP